MDERNKKMELLGRSPVKKALLAMGLPTMIGMMINALYNLVDAYFVADLGKSQMGAISVAYPLSQVIVGLGLLFGNGAASYISRLLGKGNKDAANKVASTAIYSCLSVGAILIVFTLVFLRPILDFLGATASSMDYAVTYSAIYITFSIFNVFNVTMNNIVTSTGAAKTTMLALLTGAVLNIGLDPLFIRVFDMGVAGAAIATAISQAVSTTVYLLYIFSKKSTFNFSIKECSFTKNIMQEIFKIGIPTMLFQLFTSMSVALVNIFSEKYGDSVIAGMGAVTRIISMGSLMVFGFIKGFQPIAGYSFGAKNTKRLHEAIRTSVIWSTAFCLIYGLVLAIFSKNIMLQFSKDDAEMLSVGQRALRANGLSFILFGFYTVYSSLFLALGKGKEGFILGACRQGICFIPLILIMPLLFGLNGIMYAQPASDVISALITVYMVRTLYKKDIKK